MTSLETIIARELAAAALSDRARRAMLKTTPGSEEGKRLHDIMVAADRQVSELRDAVRNHPDHSYEGL